MVMYDTSKCYTMYVAILCLGRSNKIPVSQTILRFSTMRAGGYFLSFAGNINKRHERRTLHRLIALQKTVLVSCRRNVVHAVCVVSWRSISHSRLHSLSNACSRTVRDRNPAHQRIIASVWRLFYSADNMFRSFGVWSRL